MRVLFVESSEASFAEPVSLLRHDRVVAETAADPQTALWLLAGGHYRVVVLDLQASELAREVIAAALWIRPPARVVALARGPVDPALRRRAYSAGVWELLELPAASARASTAAILSAVKRGIGESPAPAVLFVDDCGEITDGVGSLISDEGFRVDPAATTAEALRLMAVNPYALIITETRRIGPDGFEVMRQAPRLQPGVPVIAFTASLDDDTFLKAVELGARACVWKLSEPEEILEEILGAMGPGHARPRRIETDREEA